VQVVRATQN